MQYPVLAFIVALFSYDEAAVGATGVLDWMEAAIPQVAFPFGSTQEPAAVISTPGKDRYNLSLCNCSWYVAQGPASLGIAGVTNRTSRILSASESALTVIRSRQSCHLFGHPWAAPTGHPNSPNPSQHWTWNAGPGIRWSNMTYSGSISRGASMLPVAKGTSSTSSLQPINGTGRLVTPSIGSTVRYPAASSTQLGPPTTGAATLSEQSCILPPDRVAEPYAVEAWFLTTRGDMGGKVVQRAHMVYSRTGEHPPHDAYSPLALHPTTIQVAIQGSDISRSTVCTSVVAVDCPVEWYDPACSPMDQPVDPRDICLQTTVWPIQGTGFPAKKGRLDVKRGVPAGGQSSPRACPSKPITNYSSIDSIPFIEYPYDPVYTLHNITVRATAVCAKLLIDPTRRQSGDTAAQETAKWHQSLTTVYPPGSVAVLPYDNDVKIVGESEYYAWRVNRGHVIALVVDVPPSVLDPFNATTDGDGVGSPMQDVFCYMPVRAGGRRHYVHRGRRVLLDRASCVGSRSCTPDTGSITDRQDPRMQALLKQYAESDAVRGPFPSVRVGCAISYDVDFSRYRSGLMPADMTAAQNGVATLFGGEAEPYSAVGQYIPASSGRYNATVSVVASNGRAIIGGARSFGIPNEDATPADSGAVIGPYAVYRGIVNARAYPPPPNVTLPAVSGGRWLPYRTQVYGYFQGRVAVMAVCDDPDDVPVDPGVEAAVGRGSRGGWSLAASVHRIWYSYWLGYPALSPAMFPYDASRLQYVPARGSLLFPNLSSRSALVYANDSAFASISPKMTCKYVLRPSMGTWNDIYSSVWAQSLSASQARLTFDLLFDRNRWPAAQSWMEDHIGQAPGLDYPEPSTAQMKWLEDDVLNDLMDLAGEGSGSTFRRWEVAATDYELLPPQPPDNADPLNMSQLVVQISFSVRIGTSNPEYLIGLAETTSLRAMSAGAVATRLAAVLSGDRPGAEGGIWLLAVNVNSVFHAIELPCLGTFGLPMLGEECRLSAQQWFSSPMLVLQALLCTMYIACASWLAIKGVVCRQSLYAKLDSVKWVVISELVLTMQQWLLGVVLLQVSLQAPAVLQLSGQSVLLVSRFVAASCCDADVFGALTERRYQSQPRLRRYTRNQVAVEGSESIWSRYRGNADGHRPDAGNRTLNQVDIEWRVFDRHADPHRASPEGGYIDTDWRLHTTAGIDTSIGSISEPAGTDLTVNQGRRLRNRVVALARRSPALAALLRLLTVVTWKSQLLVAVWHGGAGCLSSRLGSSPSLQQEQNLLQESSPNTLSSYPSEIDVRDAYVVGEGAQHSDGVATGSTAEALKDRETTQDAAILYAIHDATSVSTATFCAAKSVLVAASLLWAALCTLGICAWDSCSNQQGSLQSVPQELLAWYRLQIVGVVWITCVVGLLRAACKCT